MTWEYSGDPTLSAKDEVRFLIGDTDDTDELLQDEEIDYLVLEFGSPTLAAANACQALAAKFSRRSIDEKAVGDLRLKYADRAAMFRTQAERLFVASGGSSSAVPAVAPYVGGLSVNEKIAADTDPDLIRSSIYVGMHDKERDDRRRRRAHSDPDYGTVGTGG
jgi:hypothetical protein